MNLRSGRAVALLSAICAGCSSIGFEPAKRELPEVDHVIQAPTARPHPKLGQDLGTIALMWRTAALENSSRLIEGRCNYDDIRARLLTGKTTTRKECNAH